MRRALLLTAGIALLPVAARAQMQPSANPVADAFRASSNTYSAWLVAAFDSIPASLYGYKPTPVQMTVGHIAVHLEEGNYLFCGNVSGMTHPRTAADSVPEDQKAEWPKDTLVARLRASFEFCNRALATLTDAQLPGEVPLFGRRTASRARVMVIFVTDLADHYSQIANYMRINNLVPPSALPRGGM